VPDPTNARPIVETPATPAPPSPPRPRRARRFVLPDNHLDERTDARIEAFVHGAPSTTERFANGSVGPDAHPSPVRPRHPFTLDTRTDWTTAVRLEDARHARYGRPASVLLIELGDGVGGPALDRFAMAVADLIRAHARETDRAVRLAQGSFRVLMPETGGRAARVAADRVERAFRETAAGRTAGQRLIIEIATPSRARSLRDALAEAEAKLADSDVHRSVTG
jgi:GGDEF domain-containing protein